jgi:predicted transcriptional regulator
MNYEDDRLPVQITTRIPAEIADELHAIARAEKRSLSNLLILAVENYIDQYKARIVSEG